MYTYIPTYIYAYEHDNDMSHNKKFNFQYQIERGDVQSQKQMLNKRDKKSLRDIQSVGPVVRWRAAG